MSDPNGNGVYGRSERRAAPRYVAYFPVKLTPPSGNDRFCVCRDVSASGGMVMTQRRLDVGQRVQLALYYSDEDRPRQVEAHVVRIDERTSKNDFWRFDAAMKFDEELGDAEAEVQRLAEEQRRVGIL